MCVVILAMGARYAEKYSADELTVKKYMGKDALDKYAEYNLSCVPAVVINGMIKMEGTASDEGTMDKALWDDGKQRSTDVKAASMLQGVGDGWRPRC